MNLSKEFSPREKVMIVVLSVLLILAIYIYAVHIPVTNTIKNADANRQILQSDLVILESQYSFYQKMNDELKDISSAPNRAVIPDYDNLQALMSFLNTTMSGTSDYTMSFGAVEQSEDEGIVRRSAQMSFECSSYEAAKTVIKNLSNCPYMCTLGDLVVSPIGYTSQRDNMSIENGSVSVSLTITFYEHM